MKFKAAINVMPLEALLDPQGKAVGNGLNNIGLTKIANVRIGKHIHMDIEAADKAAAAQQVEDACKKILVNQIMEGYSFELTEL